MGAHQSSPGPQTSVLAGTTTGMAMSTGMHKGGGACGGKGKGKGKGTKAAPKKTNKNKTPSSWKCTGHTVVIRGATKKVWQNEKTGTVAYRKKVEGTGRKPATFKFVALKPKKMGGGPDLEAKKAANTTPNPNGSDPPCSEPGQVRNVYNYCFKP